VLSRVYKSRYLDAMQPSCLRGVTWTMITDLGRVLPVESNSWHVRSVISILVQYCLVGT
jgi:hypothetical protein